MAYSISLQIFEDGEEAKVKQEPIVSHHDVPPSEAIVVLKLTRNSTKIIDKDCKLKQ